MRARIQNWARRYFPAEIASYAGLFGGAYLAHWLTGSEAAAAFAGTWGSNVGYYGMIIMVERRSQEYSGRQGLSRVLLIGRNLLMEFGIAETMDSFLTRPMFLYLGQHLLGGLFWGILIGGLLADLFFYLPTIVSYEFRKKYLSNI